jgi:hypothetical protein
MTKRASSKYIYYALQLYSSGLSLRETSKRLFTIYQKKSCIYLELDSKVQAKEEDVTKEKKNSRIHRR